MKELLIEKLQYADIEETAVLLANAFKTNGAYSVIFKNKDRLADSLLWLFKANLLIHNYTKPLTRVVKEADTKKIIGTYTLVPPQGVKGSTWAYTKIGILSFIRQSGVKPLLRMLSLDKTNKSSLTKAMKTDTYHYMSMVAISEDNRGKGIGSYAIRHAIDELISSHTPCNILGLTTQLPENVVFYSRLGFQKLDEGYIGFKGDKYYNYNMKLTF